MRLPRFQIIGEFAAESFALSVIFPFVHMALRWAAYSRPEARGKNASGERLRSCATRRASVSGKRAAPELDMDWDLSELLSGFVGSVLGTAVALVVGIRQVRLVREQIDNSKKSADQADKNLQTQVDTLNKSLKALEGAIRDNVQTELDAGRDERDRVLKVELAVFCEIMSDFCEDAAVIIGDAQLDIDLIDMCEQNSALKQLRESSILLEKSRRYLPPRTVDDLLDLRENVKDLLRSTSAAASLPRGSEERTQESSAVREQLNEVYSLCGKCSEKIRAFVET